MSEDRCPACHQPINLRPRRVCYDCKGIIAKHHKYTFQVREGILTTVHRHCEWPDMTLTPTEYRAQCGDEMADRMGVPSA